MVSDGILVIKTMDELNKYLEKYNCTGFNELSEALWYTYGVDVELDKKLKVYLEKNFNNI